MVPEPDRDAAPARQRRHDVLGWWRDEAHSTDVPRRHAIGWSTTDASRHGHCIIDSEHLRLSPEQIENHLTSDLGAEVADRPLQPAYTCWDDVDPAVRIIAGGHQLLRFDLQRHYGQNCLAGVTGELRGQGIAARIVLDSTLTKPEEYESLVWAEQRLNTFRALDSRALQDRGWTQTTPGRWQILKYHD